MYLACIDWTQRCKKIIAERIETFVPANLDVADWCKFFSSLPKEI